MSDSATRRPIAPWSAFLAVLLVPLMALTNVTFARADPAPVTTMSAELEFLAPVPAVSGVATNGAVLTATAGSWTPEPEVITYRWYLNGAAIPQATGSEYRIGAGDAGKRISVRITGAKAGYRTTSVYSDPTEPVVRRYLGVGKPVISGTPKVGATLTVTAARTSPLPDRMQYDWWVDNRRFGIGSTIVLPPSVQGKEVFVRAIGIREYFPSTSKDSERTAKVAIGTQRPLQPKISGSLVVGAQLAAEPGKGFDHHGMSYQWYRGSAAIPGATSRWYLVTEAALGKKLSVRVKSQRTGYTTLTATSPATTKIKAGTIKTTAPIIVGKKAVGQTLSVKLHDWRPGPKFTYQWLRDGKIIPGATKSSYRLQGADGGRKIGIRITAVVRGYHDAQRISTVSIIKPTASFGQGRFRIGSQVAQGIYVAPGGPDCSLWVESRHLRNKAQLANTTGQQVVSLMSADSAIESYGCGTWRPVPAT